VVPNSYKDYFEEGASELRLVRKEGNKHHHTRETAGAKSLKEENCAMF
jgi:hypothetical protein